MYLLEVFAILRAAIRTAQLVASHGRAGCGAGAEAGRVELHRREGALLLIH